MLNDFKAMLSKQLEGSGLLMEAERHIFETSTAKLIRPRFLFACGQLLGIPQSKLLKMACAVELIHTASLLHDDVVDQARTRRLKISVNSKFGNETALLAGDQLLARSILLVTETENPEKSMKAAAKTLLIMSDAAALEIAIKNQKSVSYEQILSIADGKTGALFALCGQLAGFAANDDLAADKLGSIGNLLGRIFQIKDDLKDLKEDKKNKIQTLPLNFGATNALNEIERSYSEALASINIYNNHKKFPDFLESVQELFNEQ